MELLCIKDTSIFSFAVGNCTFNALKEEMNLSLHNSEWNINRYMRINNVSRIEEEPHIIFNNEYSYWCQQFVNSIIPMFVHRDINSIGILYNSSFKKSPFSQSVQTLNNTCLRKVYIYSKMNSQSLIEYFPKTLFGLRDTFVFSNPELIVVSTELHQFFGDSPLISYLSNNQDYDFASKLLHSAKFYFSFGIESFFGSLLMNRNSTLIEFSNSTYYCDHISDDFGLTLKKVNKNNISIEIERVFKQMPSN